MTDQPGSHEPANDGGDFWGRRREDAFASETDNPSPGLDDLDRLEVALGPGAPAMTGTPPPPLPPIWGPPGQPSPPPWAPPTASEPFRSIRGLATTLTLLFIAIVPLNVWVILTQLSLTDQLDRVWDGQAVFGSFSDIERLDRLERRANALAVLDIGATIGIGVVFIVWFWRARKNIERFGARPSRGAGWAIGAWFVPCANLVLPATVAVDIWSGSQPLQQRRAPVVLGLWWVSFVGSGIVGRIAATLQPDFDDVIFASQLAEMFDQYDDWIRANIAAGALTIVAAVLTIGFVQALTSMQHDRVASGVPA
jgi:hypothetical protein